ncbi:hypothetical protein SDC9_122426 [bioreactor metagenome]|uniref:Uncharacterized protein n=1 Tax=bioreactor metagenome TaxID=1076179 RepID=A0A645CEV5_9ZZZZ
MLLDYLTELKDSLSESDFKDFIIDIERDIKINRISFGKRTSSREFINICEILKGALER